MLFKIILLKLLKNYYLKLNYLKLFYCILIFIIIFHMHEKIKLSIYGKIINNNFNIYNIIYKYIL